MVAPATICRYGLAAVGPGEIVKFDRNKKGPQVVGQLLACGIDGHCRVEGLNAEHDGDGMHGIIAQQRFCVCAGVDEAEMSAFGGVFAADPAAAQRRCLDELRHAVVVESRAKAAGTPPAVAVVSCPRQSGASPRM